MCDMSSLLFCNSSNFLSYIEPTRRQQYTPMAMRSDMQHSMSFSI